MASKLSENGGKKALERMTEANALVCRLFVNNHTPSINDAADGSDYEEPSWSGYSAQTMSDWDPVEGDPGIGYREHAQLDWMPGSGASGYVYGVFLTFASDDSLLMGISFASPKTVEEAVNIAARVKLSLKDPSVS